MENAHLLLEYAEKTCIRWKGLTWVEKPEVWRDTLIRHLTGSILDLLTAQIANGKRILVKTTAAKNINTIFKLFPEAKVVILVRDGRDEVDSAMQLSPHEAYRLWIEQWAEGARSVRNFMQASAGLRGKSWDLVWYEELVEEPGAMVSSLLRFLQMDADTFDWGRIQYTPRARHQWDKDQGARNETQKCAWRKWGWYRKRVFKRIAGEELIKFGYASNERW